MACAAAPGWWYGPALCAAVAFIWLLWRRSIPRAALLAVGLVGAFLVSMAAALVVGSLLLPSVVPDLLSALRRTVSLALRSIGVVWALHGSARGYDIGDLLAAARQVGVPPTVLSLLFVVHRHFFIYVARIGEVQRALTARSAGRRVPPGALARAAGAMFVRAAEKAETVAMALVARGFAGHIPTRRLERPPASQLLGLVACVVALWLMVLLQARH